MVYDHIRKKYYIDKNFQRKFIIKFCVLVIISSFIVCALVFLLSQDSTTVAIENSKVEVKSTADYIFPVVSMTLAIVSIFSAIICGFLVMFSSHKIVGPIQRLNKEIEFIKKGNLSRNFRIRSDDEFQKLAKNMRSMSDSMAKNHIELKSRYHDLKSFLAEKDSSLSKEDKEELYRKMKIFEEALNYFKI